MSALQQQSGRLEAVNGANSAQRRAAAACVTPERALTNTISTEDYLKARVEDQINWYDRKSCFNRNWFTRLSLVEVISAALIPFLAGYDSIYIKLTIGSLGAMIAVLAAVKGLLQLQKNWIDFRATSESLKKEKFLFLTRTEPYNGERPMTLLVRRVEALISKENTDWAHLMTKPEAGGKRQR